MKTKKLIPATVAPVQRENVATVSRDGNAIAAIYPQRWDDYTVATPFAGDDAE